MPFTQTATDLLQEIRTIPVIDCHEHLPAEEDFTSRTIDVTTLFSHYCIDLLRSFGLDDIEGLLDAEKPLAPRWNRLAPAIEAIRHTTYAAPAFLYVRDVLGFDDLTVENVEAVSEALRAENQPGLYDRILGELCGIEKCMNCDGDGAGGFAVSHPRFEHLFWNPEDNMASNDGLVALERMTGRAIHTLGQCLEGLGELIGRYRQAGAIGFKIPAAYHRHLDFFDVPTCDADRAFTRLREGRHGGLTYDEAIALENYFVRRQIEACVENDLVVAIHTGQLNGSGRNVQETRAWQLWRLLTDYPEARFDVFHGSFPYVSDITNLGKHFPNVSVNMCWMHLMGTELSRRALREWLDAMPATKIFAFGGDYCVPQKVYGHLELARRNLAVVLAERVDEGTMTRDGALRIARWMFYDNPKRWYRI